MYKQDFSYLAYTKVSILKILIRTARRNIRRWCIIITRTRADQQKCLHHLACIKPTLLFVEYFFGFRPMIQKRIRNLKKDLFISL